MLKRIFAILMTISMALPLGNVPFAQAETITGPWTWTDISGQLTERNNRPVWASAYANGNWFYTDGQDLWGGGQVYRYDGFTQVNITSDVRVAGVNRVDDIVSDGQTILFLQDVVRLDNQLKAVAYRNGQYVNITNAVRSALNSNEGVSSVNGRNGTWYIVTTQARLFRWDGSSTPSQITLPSGLVNVIDAPGSSLVYSVNHGSPANNSFGRVPLAMVPVSGSQWMLMGDPTNGSVRFFRYDGSNFSDISNVVVSNAEYVSKIVSNGTSVLVSAYANGTRNRLTDGSNSYDINGKGNLSDALIGWNGKSWMIVQGKNLSRLSGSLMSQSTEEYGRVGDKFLTLAGDGNGRMLTGGALSTTYMEDPSYPLTAKLVMVTEGIAPPTTGSNGNATSNGISGSERIYTSSNGPRVAVQGDPTDFRVGNGKEFAYRVSASDSDGVSQTDIYVNDVRIKTCASSFCEFRTAYFTTNNQSTRSVKFWTRSTDSRGNVTDTSNYPDTLVVDMNSSGGTNTTPSGNTNQTADSASGISHWTWLDPNTTTLNANQSATFNVGAWDTNGIKRMEIIANGSTIRTCDLGNATGNQTCSVSIYASNYSANTNIFVNAKITDAQDHVAWTSGTTLYRSSDTGSTNTGTGSNTGSIWTWLDPNTTTLNANQSAAFHASAQDADGLRRVEIYANGSVVRTCDFSDTSASQDCAHTFYASNYTQGTSVFVNAKATDRFGNAVWSNNTTLVRPTDNTNNNTQSGALSAWSWFDPASDLKRNATIQFRADGWAERGINSIELWVNGSIKRTCWFNQAYGTQSCSTTLFGSDYSAGSVLSANAKVTDTNNQVTWSALRSISVVNADNGNVTPPSNSDAEPSVWEWAEPNTDRITTGGSVAYNVGAWDVDGVRSITIVVNGVARPACTFNPGYSNQQCTFTLSGSAYSAGSSVFMNAVAKDANGRETWTAGKTVRVDNGTSGSSQGTVSVYSNSSWTFRANEMITFTSEGSDADGVNRVELTVNAVKVKTCTGTAHCVVTIGPFPTRSVVTFGATLFDNLGNSVSSGYKQLLKVQ